MINVLVQFIRIIPSKMSVRLCLSGLWVATKLTSWPVGISSEKNEGETIIIPFFHLPNVKSDQNPGSLKLNIYNILTIKSDSPPEDRFITGSFCLGLFLCLFQRGISARDMERSSFTHNNCCRGRRFSAMLLSDFRPVFAKHTHSYQVSVSLNTGIICLHPHRCPPQEPTSVFLCSLSVWSHETSHLVFTSRSVLIVPDVHQWAV